MEHRLTAPSMFTDRRFVAPYRHNFNGRLLAILIPAGLIGIGTGWMLIPWINSDRPGGERIITGIVGMIGTIFAAYMVFKHDYDAEPRQAKRSE